MIWRTLYCTSSHTFGGHFRAAIQDSDENYELAHCVVSANRKHNRAVLQQNGARHHVDKITRAELQRTHLENQQRGEEWSPNVAAVHKEFDELKHIFLRLHRESAILKELLRKCQNIPQALLSLPGLLREMNPSDFATMPAMVLKVLLIGWIFVCFCFWVTSDSCLYRHKIALDFDVRTLSQKLYSFCDPNSFRGREILPLLCFQV